MQNERTIKQLLELVLEEFERGEYSCLCYCVANINYFDIVNDIEHELIIDYIQNNRPDTQTSPFWWPKFKKQPRIEWLKKHIELNK